MSSQIKTLILLAALSAIILFLGAAMGGRAGLIFAMILALGMNFFSYWYSDKVVLRMYRAQILEPHEAPQLHAIVEDLARNAGIPKPRVALIPQDSPNAFATGRNPENAVVAVTSGILRLLTQDELRGVLAHEMGHVANRDILIQSVSAVLATAIMFVASMMRFAAFFGGGDDDEGANPLAAILLSILAPVAATLIQMAISRSREYLADETGAKLCGSPLSLASALAKLQQGAEQRPLQGSPATENMFIVNPLSGRSLAGLFSTHPPVEERIARLKDMARRS
ncbi:heat shock protein HtpX [Paucidesulfovibrio gracilis DSM 16080]|uniref:Protease HtpX homolog n=1 Tax=Paucidesulfovibrio gracilis DSM 16080 TaxID=1121449 RepID=A0A1T4W5K5_9BACT|nr:zinc metalloprotease HtpX [Paucidesulfovibrio gracilis]SKA72523.1 heat shock protein HtpX [Paucidesulfovibrio gracilis DSM 16080]